MDPAREMNNMLYEDLVQELRLTKLAPHHRYLDSSKTYTAALCL